LVGGLGPLNPALVLHMQASGSLKSGGQTISSGSANEDEEYNAPLTSVMGGAKSVAGSSQFKSVASFGTAQQQIFSDIGYFRGVLVALKHIRKEHIQLSRQVMLEFNEVGMHEQSYWLLD